MEEIFGADGWVIERLESQAIRAERTNNSMNSENLDLWTSREEKNRRVKNREGNLLENQTGERMMGATRGYHDKGRRRAGGERKIQKG